MTTSGVYVALQNVMSRTDRITPVKNAAAGTSSAFQLTGGQYAFEVAATTFTSATLQMLGPDGSTYITVASNGWQLTANGVAIYFLPAGTYQVVVV